MPRFGLPYFRRHPPPCCRIQTEKPACQRCRDFCTRVPIYRVVAAVPINQPRSKAPLLQFRSTA